MTKQIRSQLSLIALALLCLTSLSFAAAQSETATPLATDQARHVEAQATADATAMAIALIEPEEHHLLRRPIQMRENLAHWPDRTYPYGSTQLGARPVHLGVEFVNPRGTPVYASGAGKVVFAGSDSDIIIGPRADYYGNVVILVHDLLSLAGQPVFTLYGHLDRISVSAGQAVADGEFLGVVGSTGVAIGAHLHYEVRVAKPFDYRMTRNPELWLQYYVNNGMIAGFIHDESGQAIMEKRLVARSDELSREVYSYASDLVNRDPVWGENFTVGDLPAGEYEIIVLKENGAIAFRETVLVEAYRTTFVDIEIIE